MVLVIVLTVLGSLAPVARRQINHARINRASGVVAADFYLAQSLAAKARSPVKVVFDATAKTAFIQLPNDSVLQRRYYGPESEFKLVSLSASPSQVLVLPNGMTNGSVTVTLTDGEYTRQVRMSRAGQIRVLRS